MRTQTSLRALMTAVAVAPALAGATFAQDIDTTDFGDYIGAVTLGESRRGIQTETATSETVISQEELDARQASTLAELLGTIPGVTLSNSATPQGSSINIRGLGADAGTYGSNTKVAVVIDGVAKGQEEIYRQGSILTMEPELFKTVKVIRGPGESFRFSGGAIGGTVEAVTKDASDFLEDDDTFSVRQKLAYESNGDGFLTSSIVAWAPDDKFEVLGFYGYRSNDDYTDGAGTTQVDTAYEMPSAMLKLKYSASEALSFTASVSKTNNRLEDVSYDYIGSLFDARVDADIEDTTAYAQVQYNPLDNDLVNLTAKLTYSDELISNISDTTSSTIYNADNRTERLSLSFENEAIFATGSADHTVLVGAEVGKRTRSSISHTGSNAGSSPGGTDEFIAVYASDEIVMGNLTLTPQLRFEKQKITSEGNDTIADGTSYEKDLTVGALSSRYRLGENFAVFGTLAYNENMPIIDDLSNAFIETSEKATTVEFGVSYDAVDVFKSGDSVKAKLTGFKTQIWDNTTYSDSTGSYEDIELQGVEFEASYATAAFYMDFNASRIRGEWVTGEYFNNTPSDTAQLTLGKHFLNDQLDLAVEVLHGWSNDRTTSTSGATAASDSYTVAGLTAAYIPDSGLTQGVEFRASLDNVFDLDYQPYLSSRSAPGRNLTLSITKTF
ncbi:MULTISPECIES: TonB-dependent receptor domain-containing protein [Pacificibacter]|uniref:TonB-dependent receptor domain-containing protein n=1 Tax=Pacificibacter TaxID=1042323 RepID=UPI001C097B66|nr:MULTISPECIES: TonB-dependent receptor [Pacificibacter]MBU2937768.1 TonB-dependent receptor plug domain-containing protein [Pacificibacter marinus]MDO6616029.1 TonB-dependent receptor plug domain-containing protein [Pacificibacter sp. 1_MG-2023]